MTDRVPGFATLAIHAGAQPDPTTGKCHFAGEHCSVSNQGFMEGGAETGVAAAREILSDYKIHTKAG